MNKPSLGGGYGINRNVSGKNALAASVPAYGRVTVKPGLDKQMPGSPKMKYFQGAKSTNKK